MAKRNIFVLGDSISIHYGPYLKVLLGDGFGYDRKRGLQDALNDLDRPVGANGGDSRQVLEYLEEENRARKKYDVLLINCGLHDIRWYLDKKSIQVPISEYADNIFRIAKLGKAMSADMVWIDTTPVIDETHNTRSEKMHRFSKDLDAYRDTACRIMSGENIPVIGLYGFTEEFGRDAFIDHVHFNEFVREKQAGFIKKELMGILGIN